MIDVGRTFCAPGPAVHFPALILTATPPPGASFILNKSPAFTRRFEMYLMWQPMYYPNSIPVPIGYITWGWGGGASYISPNWVLTNGTTSTAMVTQPTTMYPTWTQLNPNPVPGCPPL